MTRLFIPVALATALLMAGCGGAPEAAENASEDAAAAPVPDGPADERSFCQAVMTRVTADECTDLTALKESLYRGGGAIHADTPMRRGETYTVTLLLDSRPAQVIDAIEKPKPAPPPEPSGPTPAIASKKGDEPIATPTPDGAEPPPVEASAAPDNAPPSYEDEAPTPYQLLEKLPGTAEKFTPWVGRFMRAELRGDGFEIKSLDEEAKEVPEDSQVRWTWSVVPTQGGPQTLFVTTRVEGRVNGTTFLLRGSETFRSITVEVGMWDRARDQFVYFTDWLKSLEGLIVAFTAVIVALFALRAVFRNKGKKANERPPAG
jgi:hypothetical protein